MGLFFIYFDGTEYILSNIQHQKTDKFVVLGESYIVDEKRIDENNSNNFLTEFTFEVKHEYISENQTRYTAPLYMSRNISEFNQQESYFWYLEITERALQYDKTNDDNLTHNIPEFIIRDDNNNEFVEFLNLIGNHFDILFIYIQNMGTSLMPRNSEVKGVPNQLVVFILNSLGINYTSKDDTGENEVSFMPPRS